MSTHGLDVVLHIRIDIDVGMAAVNGDMSLVRPRDGSRFPFNLYIF